MNGMQMIAMIIVMLVATIVVVLSVVNQGRGGAGVPAGTIQFETSGHFGVKSTSLAGGYDFYAWVKGDANTLEEVEFYLEMSTASGSWYTFYLPTVRGSFSYQKFENGNLAPGDCDTFPFVDVANEKIGHALIDKSDYARSKQMLKDNEGSMFETRLLKNTFKIYVSKDGKLTRFTSELGNSNATFTDFSYVTSQPQKVTDALTKVQNDFTKENGYINCAAVADVAKYFTFPKCSDGTEVWCPSSGCLAGENDLVNSTECRSKFNQTCAKIINAGGSLSTWCSNAVSSMLHKQRRLDHHSQHGRNLRHSAKQAEYPGCKANNLDFIGDGFCDGDAYNNAECGWDGGDCCMASCTSKGHRLGHFCGENGYDCKDPGNARHLSEGKKKILFVHGLGNDCAWEDVAAPDMKKFVNGKTTLTYEKRMVQPACPGFRMDRPQYYGPDSLTTKFPYNVASSNIGKGAEPAYTKSVLENMAADTMKVRPGFYRLNPDLDGGATHEHISQTGNDGHEETDMYGAIGNTRAHPYFQKHQGNNDAGVHVSLKVGNDVIRGPPGKTLKNVDGNIYYQRWDGRWTNRHTSVTDENMDIVSSSGQRSTEANDVGTNSWPYYHVLFGSESCFNVHNFMSGAYWGRGSMWKTYQDANGQQQTYKEAASIKEVLERDRNVEVDCFIYNSNQFKWYDPNVARRLADYIMGKQFIGKDGVMYGDGPGFDLVIGHSMGNPVIRKALSLIEASRRPRWLNIAGPINGNAACESVTNPESQMTPVGSKGLDKHANALWLLDDIPNFDLDLPVAKSFGWDKYKNIQHGRQLTTHQYGPRWGNDFPGVGYPNAVPTRTVKKDIFGNHAGHEDSTSTGLNRGHWMCKNRDSCLGWNPGNPSGICNWPRCGGWFGMWNVLEWRRGIVYAIEGAKGAGFVQSPACAGLSYQNSIPAAAGVTPTANPAANSKAHLVDQARKLNSQREENVNYFQNLHNIVPSQSYCSRSRTGAASNGFRGLIDAGWFGIEFDIARGMMGCMAHGVNDIIAMTGVYGTEADLATSGLKEKHASFLNCMALNVFGAMGKTEDLHTVLWKGSDENNPERISSNSDGLVMTDECEFTRARDYRVIKNSYEWKCAFEIWVGHWCDHCWWEKQGWWWHHRCNGCRHRYACGFWYWEFWGSQFEGKVKLDGQRVTSGNTYTPNCNHLDNAAMLGHYDHNGVQIGGGCQSAMDAVIENIDALNR